MNRMIQALTLLILSGILVCLGFLAWEFWPREGQTFRKNSSQTTADVSREKLTPPPSSFRVESRLRRSGQPPRSVLEDTPPQAPIEPPEQHPDQSALDPGYIESHTVLGGNQTKPNIETVLEPHVLQRYGNVAGRIRLEGAPPPEVSIVMDAVCGSFHAKPVSTRHYLVGEEGGLADVVVYLEREDHPKGVYAVTQEIQELRNIGCLFEPFVFGLRTGQPLRVINSDPILHNVHATPKQNHEFNIGLTPGPSTQTDRTFSTPERFIRFKCDVHPWMFAYASVFDHPYYAVSGADGAYALPYALPPGQYTLRAQHHKAGILAQRVTLQEGNLEVNFTFRIGSLAGAP